MNIYVVRFEGEAGAYYMGAGHGAPRPGDVVAIGGEDRVIFRAVMAARPRHAVALYQRVDKRWTATGVLN